MKFFEIVEGPDYQRTLEELDLTDIEIEEMREAVDWKLSRNPESGERVHTETITIFYESYLLRPSYYLLIAYRIEGEKVVLLEVHRDSSQEF
jgi:hypothetical protein